MKTVRVRVEIGTSTGEANEVDLDFQVKREKQTVVFHRNRIQKRQFMAFFDIIMEDVRNKLAEGIGPVVLTAQEKVPGSLIGANPYGSAKGGGIEGDRYAGKKADEDC